MADNRRYYWLKLKEDFFTDKRIKRLRKIYRTGKISHISQKCSKADKI